MHESELCNLVAGQAVATCLAFEVLAPHLGANTGIPCSYNTVNTNRPPTRSHGTSVQQHHQAKTLTHRSPRLRASCGISADCSSSDVSPESSRCPSPSRVIPYPDCILSSPLRAAVLDWHNESLACSRSSWCQSQQSGTSSPSRTRTATQLNLLSTLVKLRTYRTIERHSARLNHTTTLAGCRRGGHWKAHNELRVKSLPIRVSHTSNKASSVARHGCQRLSLLHKRW